MVRPIGFSGDRSEHGRAQAGAPRRRAGRPVRSSVAAGPVSAPRRSSAVRVIVALRLGLFSRSRRKSATSRDRSWHSVERGHGGRAHRVANEGDLAEVLAAAEPDGSRGDVDLDLAGHDEEHRVRGIAAPDDGELGGDHLALEQPGDLGDPGGVQSDEQRDVGDRLPGHDEVPLPDLAREPRGEDARRHREDRDPDHHHHAAEEPCRRA